MRARMAALFLVGAALAGCGSTDSADGETTETTETTETSTTEDTVATTPDTPRSTHGPAPSSATSSVPVHLEAIAALGTPTEPGLDPSSQGLAVTYTVRNTGSEPVLVARERGHTQDTSAFGPRNDEAVWVRVEGDVLVLTKELLPLPPGQVEEVETTLAADLLEPGASVDGTAFVPRPVEITFPLAEDKGSRVERLPGQWQLCLSVAPAGDRTDVIGRLDGGQELVCSEPAALPDGLALR